MEYLANQHTKMLKDFYDNLPETDEPLSKEELQQMKDAEFIVRKELGWDDEARTKQKKKRLNS